MKHIKQIMLVLFIGLIQFSCKKDNDNKVTIIAKWNLVNDSSSVLRIGIPEFTYINYVGLPSDYYDFRTNGNVYIKEGVNSDTMGYKVNGSIISFYPKMTNENYTLNITSLTSNNATLTLGNNPQTNDYLTPEGYEVKIINLKK